MLEYLDGIKESEITSINYCFGEANLLGFHIRVGLLFAVLLFVRLSLCVQSGD